MTQVKKSAVKKLKSTAVLKEIMAKHYFKLNKASREKSSKVAWCSSVGPAELLRSMGFLLYFPENHAAILGATKAAEEYIPAANAEGYSPDICSYLTSDIGAYLKGITHLSRAYDRITQLPDPDLLVYNTNQCRDVKDWFIWYSKKFNVPCIGVESFCGLDHVTRDHVKAVSLQMAKLVPKLEDISETKFNTEHFQKTIDLSRRCSILWRQVLESAANRPSPFTFFDGTVHMGPAVVERGTDAAIKYYEYLLTELKLRTTAGISAVENEKYRIYWEGMPIWGRLRKMAELFISLNACVAASTYCNSWIFSSLDPQEPFDSMARAYTELFIVRSDQAKERYIEKMVKQYKIDGIIFHESKTCPNNSNSRYGMHRRLAKALNIPTVVIYGDQNDLRLFSEEQSITKIEAFMEQIRENHK